ncbi:hypothetical protein AURDEDRAFT_114458 [Auricularia subglabra TFB-10046 SS5]|nr:hypothetical protein AURDEDRAFT_114458 [Auricularia subglabra TFB-10046 SS5]
MAPHSISWSSALLVQTILVSVLYGLAILLFVHSMRALLRRAKMRDMVNYPLFISAPFLFVFATLHVLGTWLRAYRGFVVYAPGPEAYWALITTPEKTLGQAGQIAGVALADGMTVYRCWAIWDRRWTVVLVPTLTLVATFVSSVVFVTLQHHVDVQTSIFDKMVTQWTEAWLASSLITTGICTLLITWRLVRVQTSLRESGAHIGAGNRTVTSRVVVILIESAAIYSINNLLYCVLYAVNQVPETWFSGMESTVASITFSLIIIRVDHAVETRKVFMSTPVPLSGIQQRSPGAVFDLKAGRMGASAGTGTETEL